MGRADEQALPAILERAMPANFSKLFFRSAKKLARLQHKAWRQALGGMPAQRRPAKSRKPARAAPAGPSAALAGEWQTRRRFLAAPGLSLGYCLYTPRLAPGAPAPPLVVMLHGCKLTAEEFARGTDMNRLADRHAFAVLYPEQALSRNGSRCWRWFEPATGRGWAEADAIAALVRRQLATGVHDARRVYVAGLSAGAGMAALAALRHPDLFAAIALHSGPVVGAAHNAMSGLHTMRRGALEAPIRLIETQAAPNAAALGLPTMLLHGMRDNAVSTRNLRQLVEQFAHLNQLDTAPEADVRVVGAGTRREYRMAQGRRGTRAMLAVVEIPALEHAWSGGNAQVPYHAADGPVASALVWRFFRGHRRP